MSAKTENSVENKSDSTDVTIELDYPIKRGDTVIDKVVFRRPTGADLEGLNSGDLLIKFSEDFYKLVARISSPSLIKSEVKKLDGSDIVDLQATVLNFFMKKKHLLATSQVE